MRRIYSKIKFDEEWTWDPNAELILHYCQDGRKYYTSLYILELPGSAQKCYSCFKMLPKQYYITIRLLSL